MTRAQRVGAREVRDLVVHEARSTQQLACLVETLTLHVIVRRRHEPGCDRAPQRCVRVHTQRVRRDVVDADREHRGEARAPRRVVLPRRAVDQIEPDARDAGRAGEADRLRGALRTVEAVEHAEHRRIERLCTHRQPVHARLGQHTEELLVRGLRVALDGDFDAVGDVELA